MSYNPNNPNGQATMAASAPVVIASNPTAVPVTVQSSATGGDTTFHLVSAATTNAGTPTAGSLTGLLFTLVIPALSAANVSLPSGITFSAGIGITTVTGIADTDATAVILNDLNINIFYK